MTARQLAASRHESVSAVLDTVSWTTAPVAEELIKIAPLLLAGWALRGRMRWGLADFAVLGGALGAGFSLLEELLMYAGSGAKAVPRESGGWQIPASLMSQVYVPGPGEVLGHWFPAPTGLAVTGGLVVRMPYDMHVFASVLAGAGVGLLLCGAGRLVRACGVLPVTGAIAVHWVHNYAAVFPDNEMAGSGGSDSPDRGACGSSWDAWRSPGGGALEPSGSAYGARAASGSMGSGRAAAARRCCSPSLC
ncbi:PrsW family glutamic-type intramembrane protease [Streptomyces sp. NPDC096323]|uniref:PrsW family glutamic-type intramembrane protease n=1 Tax=Streptomyces sp. NPDC096323 TaxID=3155822 RepID=UPI00333078AA